MRPTPPSRPALAYEPDSTGIFAAESYTEWARGVIRLRDTASDVAILFDSTIGEPKDELSQVVRAAFTPQATSRFVSVYVDGNPYAVAALGARYGLATDQILTTTGTTSAFALALKALVRRGDRVLVERPGFDVHTAMATEAGARVETFARPAPGFQIDLDDLRARLGPDVRAVVLTNLHNPSGVLLSPDSIVAAAALAATVGAILIVDEVYADFAGPATAANLAPNIIAISSLTKVYGLFALKFGWLAARAELVAAIRAAIPEGDTGVSKLSHAVAAHVLEAPEAFEAHWRRTLAATRPLVVRAADTLRAAGLVEGETPPLGCMYFPRIVGVDDTIALAQRLFERHRVLVAPGEYFGLPGHLRIGFGSGAADLEIGLERLIEGLRAL